MAPRRDRETPSREKMTPSSERDTPSRGKMLHHRDRDAPSRGKMPHNRDRDAPSHGKMTPRSERDTPSAWKMLHYRERDTPSAWKMSFYPAGTTHSRGNAPKPRASPMRGVRNPFLHIAASSVKHGDLAVPEWLLGYLSLAGAASAGSSGGVQLSFTHPF